MAEIEVLRLAARLHAETGNSAQQIDKVSGSVDRFKKGARDADKVSRGFFSGMLGNAAKLGLLAGGVLGLGVGIGKLTGFIRGGIQESKEWSAGLGRLDSVLKSTGGAAGVTREQVLKLNESLSGASGFSKIADEVVLGGQNVLLQFTNLNKNVFPRATEMLLNMGQAAAGADGQVTDLSRTALKLGRALNDPLKGMSALTRMGVSFTEQQKDQIKVLMESGNLLGAQNIILDELAKKYGGAATAAAQTLDGAMFTLNERLNNVKQSVGDQLVPLMTRFAQLLGSEQVMGTIQRLTDIGIGGLVRGFDLGEKAITTFQRKVSDIRTDILPLTDAVGMIASIVKNQFAPAIRDVFVGDFDNAIERFQFGWGGIRNAFTDAGAQAGSFKDKVINALRTLRDDIRTRAPQIAQGLQSAVTFSVTIASGWVDMLVADARVGFTEAQRRIEQEVIPTFTANLTNGLPTAINASFQAVGGPAVSANNAVDIAGLFMAFFPAARLLGAGLFVANQIAPEFFAGIVEGIRGVLNDPSRFAGKAGDLWGDFMTTLFGGGLPGNLKNEMARFGEIDPENFRSMSSGFIGGLTQAIGQVAQWASTEGARLLSQAMSGLASGLWAWITDPRTLQGAQGAVTSFSTAVAAYWQANGPKFEVDPVRIKEGVERSIEKVDATIDPEKMNLKMKEGWSFIDNVILPFLEKELPSWPGKIGTAVGNARDQIFTGFFSGLAGVKDADTSNGTQTFVDALLLAIQNVPNALAQMKETVGRTIWNAFWGIVTGVDTTKQQIDLSGVMLRQIAWDKIQEIGKSILINIFGGFLQQSTAPDQSREDAIANFIEGMRVGFVNGVNTLAWNVAETLRKALLENLQRLPIPPDWLKDVLPGLSTPLPAPIEIKPSFTETSKTELTNLGRSVPPFVTKGLMETKGTLTAGIGQLSTAALTTGKGGFSSGSWQPLGLNAGTGLANGIIAARGKVIAAAKALAQAAISTINTQFDSHSPSRVMIDTGTDVDTGLAIGIERGTSFVIIAVEKMTNQVMDFGRAKMASLAHVWVGVLPKEMGDAISKTTTWSGLLDALDGAVDGVIENGATSMRRLGQGLWGIMAGEFTYSSEKGWHRVIEEMDAHIADAVARTPLAKTKATAAKYAGEELSQITTDPAIIGPMTKLGEDLWGIASGAFEYNAEKGSWQLATSLAQHIINAVQRTDVAKLKETMRKFGEDVFSDFSTDQSLLDRANEVAADAARTTEDARQRTAASMISPLASLAGAKMPTKGEIDVFFAAYEHWLAEFNKRADLFASTAKLTTSETTTKMAAIGESVSKIFDPLLKVTEIQAINPGAIEGAMSNVWNLLDQFNKVMAGGTEGIPFQGDWMKRALQFASDITSVFTGVKAAFAVVGEAGAIQTNPEGIASMFGALKTAISDLLTGPWTTMKLELDPQSATSFAGMFLDMWDYDNRPGTSLAKKHNTSIQAMGTAVDRLLPIQASGWKKFSADVVSYIDGITSAIGRLNTAVETMRQPGATPPQTAPSAPPTGGAGPLGIQSFGYRYVPPTDTTRTSSPSTSGPDIYVLVESDTRVRRVNERRHTSRRNGVKVGFKAGRA